MSKNVGIRSLSVSFPSVLRTNEYWRKKYPNLIANAEAELARLWKKQPSPRAFDVEMAPYLADPFRGTVQRRILGPGESPLSLELRAARDALAAASMTPDDIDCLIVTSFLGDQPGVGNSAMLSKALEYKGAAWNLETACSSSLVALQTAAALVRAGEHKNVLVASSCTYSRVSDDTDSTGWFLGDGAGAFVVGEVPDGQGVLGTKVLNTSATCDTFYYGIDTNGPNGPRIRIHARENTGRVIRDISEPFVVECTTGALKAAGLTLKDVDVLSGNTATAWMAKFYARALDIDPARVVNTYPMYANIGPALMPVNLYHAARTNLLKPGQVVVLYSIGSVSSAGAIVMRWGDARLGPEPAPPTIVE